ncbi:hypothetical protein ACFRFH_19685 [Leifsonia sp. NPDC056824]|uniref:hypothetical protein n=1 Tax=Leifsonia sp. NPDC056824 TaxID=3345953 RepID=UPI0036C1052C
MSNPNDDVLALPNGLSAKSRAELLDETVQQTNGLVQLLGGEWLDSGSPPSAFDSTDPSAWRHPDPCDMNGVAEQYSVFISQVRPIEDPTAVIDRVRSYWKGLGYAVGQMAGSDADNGHDTQLNVALEHKAALQFNASTTGMVIWISSECVAIDG